jgi:hypothetical protein
MPSERLSELLGGISTPPAQPAMRGQADGAKPLDVEEARIARSLMPDVVNLDRWGAAVFAGRMPGDVQDSQLRPSVPVAGGVPSAVRGGVPPVPADGVLDAATGTVDDVPAAWHRTQVWCWCAAAHSSCILNHGPQRFAIGALSFMRATLQPWTSA